MNNNLTAIVLTFNEEKNIEECLQSLQPLNADIFILDSGSTDRTLEICRRFTSNIFDHPFTNYGAQRNWALQNLPFNTEWVINVDADHRVTEGLAQELNDILSKPVAEDINGFLVSRRTMFMNKWIKHGGHYPTYHAIIFRKGFGSCEDKLYDQHFKIEGKTVILKNDIIDIITDSLNTFTARHNKWSDLEAQHQFFKQDEEKQNNISGSLTGNPIQKRRYIKSVYEKFPLFVRPFIYYFIRYFIRLGFLDGKEGLIFHFLQGFWFRFLVDAKIYELRKQQKKR